VSATATTNPQATPPLDDASASAPPPRTGAFRERLALVLPAVVVGVGFLVLWELFVVWRDIKPFLLPKPTVIWEQITSNFSGIWSATQETGANAFVGLVVGTALGIVVALIASRFRIIGEVATPLAAAVNAMPIIALAPLLYNMFSATSAYPRRLVVTIIVFFPIFVNMLRGLVQVDATKQELMASYAASPWDVLRKVKVPNALPFLFTGLKLASALAVIAAIVVEYFGGVQNGLGSRITSASASTAFPRAWAYVSAAIVLGLAFYLAVVILERLVLPWQAHRRAR
jgi:NitT/TauT family transport system permease protein